MITYREIESDPIQKLSLVSEKLVCIDCGILPYEEALSLQELLNDGVQRAVIPSVFLLIEHPSVITFGIHQQHNLLSSSEETLSGLGISCVPIRRGGGGTAHNIGQLVIYPIISLPAFGFRVAPFVHYLEDVGAYILTSCHVAAQRRPRYPGLWVEQKKIASLGVQITKGVSMHGIAINISNDLSIFSHIVPCGIEGVEMTSVLKEVGSAPSIEKLKQVGIEAIEALLPQHTRLEK